MTAIDLRKCDRIPPQSILVGGLTRAFIDDLDAWDSLAGSSPLSRWITDFRPSIIFKVQFRRGVAYPRGTVSAGYICHPDAYREMAPADLLSRERPIDVTSRMRTGGYKGPVQPWMEERERIVEQAAELAHDGYIALQGKIALAHYLRELPDARVGFHWRGWGRMSYRLIEYFRAGVVPITQPLGREWPIREDIAIEDGVTGVFCDSPDRFGSEARALLRDRSKLAWIRRNVCELWTSSLALPAMGQWYWDQLANAHRAALCEANSCAAAAGLPG